MQHSPTFIWFNRRYAVPESPDSEPAFWPPGPVGGDGVDDCGHEGAEDDVAVEVAPLSDGARHDGGARRSERALQTSSNYISQHFTQILPEVSPKRKDVSNVPQFGTIET